MNYINAFLDRIHYLLNYLGLYKKKAKLLFLGLDNAGKTTLLHMLKDDRVGSHAPTQRPTNETMQIGLVTFTAFDMGGHESARSLWKDYYVDVSAIIFMVDATDRGRFVEAQKELHALLNDEILKGIPFLILGNKIDAVNACSEQELEQALYLPRTGKEHGHRPAEQQRPLELFMCSVVRRSGYADGIRWLASFL